MEKLEGDKRQPEETWAHYITRRIGRENFDVYRKLAIGFSATQPGTERMQAFSYNTEDGEIVSRRIETISLESIIGNRGGYDIAVTENLVFDESNPVQTFEQVETETDVSITKAKADIDDFILFVQIGDGDIIVRGYDPAIVPPDFVSLMEAYKKHEDIRAFVDDLITGIKKILEGGDGKPKR